MFNNELSWNKLVLEPSLIVVWWRDKIARRIHSTVSKRAVDQASIGTRVEEYRCSDAHNYYAASGLFSKS